MLDFAGGAAQYIYSVVIVNNKITGPQASTARSQHTAAQTFDSSEADRQPAKRARKDPRLQAKVRCSLRIRMLGALPCLHRVPCCSSKAPGLYSMGRTPRATL